MAAPARTLNLHVFGALLLLSLLAIAINGYHPYSEDGGIYLAGVKHAANPGLYGASAPFITAFSNLSFFSDWIAWAWRSLHLPLDFLLFSLQVATTWLLLYACLELARRSFANPEAQWASVVLVAMCLSVPVAGTALFIMDPYLTSRSFSTPLTLLAVCACLDRKLFRATMLLIVVGLFHPLMAIYATGFAVVLWAVQRRPVRARAWAGVAALMAVAVAAGAAVQFSQRAVIESAAYRAAVMTRSYFFLCRWQWYELFGLAAPLLILAAWNEWQRRSSDSDLEVGPEIDSGVHLARSCVAVGATSIAVSLLFARPDSHSHLIAALQTMRSFQVIYVCMFLLIGGLLGEFLLRRVVRRWAILFLFLGVALGLLQHRAYPASPQIELPGFASSNGWNRAFVWIRSNTPPEAVVALDADYIHAPGEDAQGFRAIAERSSLADASKDGGAAAAFPRLAEQWVREQTAQVGLNYINDAERIRRLRPFNVSWMVLDRSARTAMPCPFEDELVKVCRLD